MKKPATVRLRVRRKRSAGFLAGLNKRVFLLWLMAVCVSFGVLWTVDCVFFNWVTKPFWKAMPLPSANDPKFQEMAKKVLEDQLRQGQGGAGDVRKYLSH